MKPFNTDQLFSWNGKYFISEDKLSQLAKKGFLEMAKLPGGSYGYNYEFSFNGVLIASIYKDDTRGFCSQATSVLIDRKLINQYN
jgi:hypothetical protein